MEVDHSLPRPRAQGKETQSLLLGNQLGNQQGDSSFQEESTFVLDLIAVVVAVPEVIDLLPVAKLDLVPEVVDPFPVVEPRAEPSVADLLPFLKLNLVPEVVDLLPFAKRDLVPEVVKLDLAFTSIV